MRTSPFVTYRVVDELEPPQQITFDRSFLSCKIAIDVATFKLDNELAYHVTYADISAFEITFRAYLPERHVAVYVPNEDEPEVIFHLYDFGVVEVEPVGQYDPYKVGSVLEIGRRTFVVVEPDEDLKHTAVFLNTRYQDASITIPVSRFVLDDDRMLDSQLEALLEGHLAWALDNLQRGGHAI